MNKLFVRIRQFFCAIYIRTLKVPKQNLYVGNDSIFRLVKELKKLKMGNIFVVSDKNITKLNLLGSLLETLKVNNFNYFLFDEIESDPSIETVENGVKKYRDNNCDSLIAIGGGSVLDCAKVIGARVSDPHRSIFKLKKLLGGIRRFNVPFMAIPTTAGTGSENTLYALITNKDSKEKYPLFSTKFIPTHVAIDPHMTVNLPISITAYTGMDALTHALESYLSTFSKYLKKDKQNSLEALKMIFDNLEKVYKEPTNLKYRENMAIASYKAGMGFRRIGIGYIHNFAHRMGEFYHLSHGLANAIILPYILEFMLPKVQKQLSEIALYCKLGDSSDSQTTLATAVVEKINQLNSLMKIPSHIKEIKEADLEILSKRILKESYMCGNPRLMNKKECKDILMKIQGNKK